MKASFLLREATSFIWLLFYRKSHSMSLYYLGFSTPKPISLNYVFLSVLTSCYTRRLPPYCLNPQGQQGTDLFALPRLPAPISGFFILFAVPSAWNACTSDNHMIVFLYAAKSFCPNVSFSVRTFLIILFENR